MFDNSPHLRTLHTYNWVVDSGCLSTQVKVQSCLPLPSKTLNSCSDRPQSTCKKDQGVASQGLSEVKQAGDLQLTMPVSSSDCKVGKIAG